MKAFVGIDIQKSRGCCFAVIGSDENLLKSGWFHHAEEETPQLIKKLQNGYEVFVGIDAPRKPLTSPRKWYWNRNRWRTRRSTEKGYGRHCEIVLRAHGLANPQYTPLEAEAKPWMIIGFKVFSAIEDTVSTYEVFPTASYALLQGISDVRLFIDFSACKSGPKDVLDAFVAAATVREYISGRGTEVGGGDSLGKIILPRPLRAPVIEGVLSWPQGQQEKRKG